MPFLLRAINNVRRWDKVAWLEEGKGQAMALLDLKPEENKLSFWHVESNESNLNIVIAAIIAGKDDCPQAFDYALFDQSLLEETGVRIEHTPGHSFHKEADKYWHRDTTKLSADNVAEIVNIIMIHNGIRPRIHRSSITQILIEERDSGMIDIAALKKKSKQKLSSHWLEQLPS